MVSPRRTARLRIATLCACEPLAARDGAQDLLLRLGAESRESADEASLGGLLEIGHGADVEPIVEEADGLGAEPGEPEDFEQGRWELGEELAVLLARAGR